MDPTTPAEVAVRETLAFALRNLPPAPARLLEVGCGNGSLAVQLGRRGFEITAIDTSAELVGEARGAGVDARTADWLTFPAEGRFDAILFTRSLHHIAPLSEAVHRIDRPLAPGGTVLVEDFAFSECDRATARWGQAMVRELHLSGHWQPRALDFATSLLQSPNPFDAWHENHGEDLHSVRSMVASLEAHGYDVRIQAAPYLYRYMIPGMEASSRGSEKLLRFLEHELKAIAERRVLAIGARLVARALPGPGPTG